MKTKFGALYFFRITRFQLQEQNCCYKTPTFRQLIFDNTAAFPVPRLFTAQSKLRFSSFVHELEIRQLKVLTFFLCFAPNELHFQEPSFRLKFRKSSTVATKFHICAEVEGSKQTKHLFHLFSDKCKCA